MMVAQAFEGWGRLEGSKKEREERRRGSSIRRSAGLPAGAFGLALAAKASPHLHQEAHDWRRRTLGRRWKGRRDQGPRDQEQQRRAARRRGARRARREIREVRAVLSPWCFGDFVIFVIFRWSLSYGLVVKEHTGVNAQLNVGHGRELSS